MMVPALRKHLLWVSLTAAPVVGCNAGGDGDFNFGTDSNGPITSPTSTAASDDTAGSGTGADTTAGTAMATGAVTGTDDGS
ncbi:MAG: hypothetical protein K0V04_26045, partial [Deltaproteobacteria bacterium]|nr:hypothetical protein [Deltaproteobacteria bacterium]